MGEGPRLRRWRHQVHAVLDRGAGNQRAAAFVHGALIGLILVNVGAVVLQSVPTLEAAYAPAFFAIEIVSVIAFSIEYALRLWTAPEHRSYRALSPTRARLAYSVSPAAVIDFIAIVPVYVALVGEGEFQVVLLLRLLRFLKLARYSPGMRSLANVLYQERKALLACLVILAGLALVTATAMHLVERTAQPERFGSIPDALWWAIVTLTTVGYGDVVPVTPLGKMIAGVTALMGIVMLALPVGIVATAFAEDIHRREFVVTWSMVARVPLFSSLEAVQIAEIIHFLRAQTVPAGAVIVRKGDPGHCMYFIATGAVEIDLAPGRVRLDEGHFFGETAVLRSVPRTATVKALAATKLLVLDASDLHALMDRHPEIALRITESVRERQGAGLAPEPGKSADLPAEMGRR